MIAAAKRTVFLSSTCYDLSELRTEIEAGVLQQGFEPLLSDRASFPVDPKIHRHDVCVATAKKADFFILFIGERFGAPYHRQPNISVTWAEYRGARESRVPILAFVPKDVWNERNKWKLDPGYKPSVDARNFDFISEVQTDPAGHWVEMLENPGQALDRLGAMVELFGGPWVLTESSGTRISDGRIEVASVAPEVQHLAELLGMGDYLKDEDLMWMRLNIPEQAEVRSDARSVRRLHGFVLLVEPFGSEDQAIVRPTSLGIAVRDQLEHLLVSLS